MGNIDFTNAPGFSTYVLLLIGSGILMLVLAATVEGSKGIRFANLAFGAGFVVYGGYLAFVFSGGTYFIFFKAFILPVVMLVKTIQAAAQKKSAPTLPPPAPGAAAAPLAPPTAAPGLPAQPTGYSGDPVAPAPAQD